MGTWPHLHCPIVLDALAAGKHVLTEARMAMDAAEARQMHAAAQKSSQVAMVVKRGRGSSACSRWVSRSLPTWPGAAVRGSERAEVA